MTATTDHGDLERLVAPIVTAFSGDPFVRWLFPETAEYLTYFSAIARIHGQCALEHKSAFEVDGFKGAALWSPPGVRADRTALGNVVEQAFDGGEREDVFKVFQRMGESEPSEPHWFLHLIGVDTVQQGRGYGSALLAESLNEVDRQHLPAYLESTSPGSRALYERHGFAAFDEIQAGDSPPLWPMLRPAR